MTKALRYSLFAAAILVGLLLYLLTAASANTQLFETYYAWIFGANVGAGALLFVLVLFLLGRLFSRYRRQVELLSALEAVGGLRTEAVPLSAATNGGRCEDGALNDHAVCLIPYLT